MFHGRKNRGGGGGKGWRGGGGDDGRALLYELLRHAKYEPVHHAIDDLIAAVDDVVKLQSSRRGQRTVPPGEGCGGGGVPLCLTIGFFWTHSTIEVYLFLAKMVSE